MDYIKRFNKHEKWHEYCSEECFTAHTYAYYRRLYKNADRQLRKERGFGLTNLPENLKQAFVVFQEAQELINAKMSD